MRYRFGIIFDFGRYLRRNDPTDVFQDVDLEKLLVEIIRFLTEDDDPLDTESAAIYGRINEIDYLVNLLYDKRIIGDTIFHGEESYLKICSVLYAICETLVEVLMDTGFYKFCRSYYKDKPKVIRLSRKRNNFAIVVRPSTRE
jgi:hypothetical protein